MNENILIKKVVQGSYHQGDIKFGDSAGKQCSCMSLMAIFISTIRKITIWKDLDLDFILEQGDKLYKSLEIKRALYVNELPSEFNIFNIDVEIDFPKISDGFCDSNVMLVEKEYFYHPNFNGAILFVNGYCIAVLNDKKKENIFVFDSHSRNQRGQLASDGYSMLLMFSTLNDFQNYIFFTYKVTHFQVVYVRVKQLQSEEKVQLTRAVKTFKARKCQNKKIIETMMQPEQKKNIDESSGNATEQSKPICLKRKRSSEKNSNHIKKSRLIPGEIKEHILIKKVVQGSYHQGDIKFGDSAGKQCSCMSLMAIFISTIRKITIWKGLDLDFVLKQGDELYKSLEIKRALYVNELPSEFNIFNIDVNIDYPKISDGFCDSNVMLVEKEYFYHPNFNGAILFVNGYCIAILNDKKKENIFVFDSHSRNQSGQSASDGYSMLLMFSTLNDFQNYIFFTYKVTHYQVVYVRVKQLKAEEKIKLTRGFTKFRNKIKTTQKKLLDDIENNKKTRAEERIHKFQYSIAQGPFYVCVSCHRCLYKRSVKCFEISNYQKGGFDPILSLVASFDEIHYICNTCDKKMLKQKIPCQSVNNKLELYNFPSTYSVLNKLERVLVSQRILFTKVVILPKGEFPKLKGAVCNIPVETERVCNTLPRSMNDSGVIFVKLKRKLGYKSHTISESVRPEIIQLVLNYLKSENHLYTDTTIKNTSDFQSRDEVIDENEEDFCMFPDTSHSNNNVDDDFDSEDPLNQHRLSCAETTLISKCPHVIADDENIVLAPGEGKAPVFILTDEFCEELSFPHLFPKGKYGYKVNREIKLSHTKYFNQRLLNYSQRFASDSDYIFFANFVSQQINLRSKINIAMRKVSGKKFTASMFANNFKETINSFLVNDNAYSFMNTIKGTPAYWKNMLSDILAMVKQLGLPSFFLTLSCADLRWDELVIIISKLRGSSISKDEISSMSYFDRCNLLNSNPVLLARHFQYRVEAFFKDIILNGPLGKILYYAIRVEFQTRGSPHVHCLLWVEHMPVLKNDTINEYNVFIDSVISANIPETPSKLHDLVQRYQVHHHSKTCKKYINKECRFGFGHFFTHKTIIAKPIQEQLSLLDKIEIQTKQKQILSKVKNYIDTNLNPKKKNFLNPEKPNFEQTLSIENILNLLNISLKEYENALSISTDANDYEIHLKRNPNSCFVNYYFEEGLLAWEANIDLQPVFNYYKAIHYMCAYFSKNENSCSNAMKQVLEQSKDLKKYESMTKVAKAYSDNRECSVQEAVYQLMPELWLRKGYPVVSFVNTNLPQERFYLCKSEKEILELPGDSENVFKKNMLDRYIDRPDKYFLGGKYKVIDNMCLAEFTANYRLDSSSDSDVMSNDNQPSILNDFVIEENHTSSSFPNVVPLMSSKQRLKCRKVKKVLRYFTPNIHKYPEKYAHHILMLYYPFRDEDNDLKLDGLYFNRLQDSVVKNIVNKNKDTFEPNSEVVDAAFKTYKDDMILNQDAYGQQENEEVAFIIDKVLDLDLEKESDEFESVDDLTNFLPKPFQSVLISDEELNTKIKSLNNKQREIFNVVYTWCKQFVQNKNSLNSLHIEPIHVFLTGNGGCGKSHLIKCMYQALKKLLSHNGDISKEKVLLLAPTGVAAINIDGTTIHTGLGIPCSNFFPLSDKQRTNLRNKLEDVCVIFIDEISMVSSKLLLQTHQRLCEIFGRSDRIPFGGKTIIASGDLYQLPPVLAKPVFSVDGFIVDLLKLWHLFKLAELDEVMRQQGDNQFISLLNNIRNGSLSPENEIILKSRFISPTNPDYPWKALHIFAENSLVNEHNRNMLDSISSAPLTVIALDNYPLGMTPNEIKLVRGRKSSETGGLAFSLTLKVGCRVMLTANINIDDRLINGQIGTVQRFAVLNGKCQTIYVKFDDKTAGAIKNNENNYNKANWCVPIEKIETKFTASKRKTSGVIIRTQFPLSLSYACTVHKVQGLTLEKIVVSFHLERQRNFNPGQMYVALSRAKTLNSLFLTGNYSLTAMHASEKVHAEYQRLRKKENLLQPIQSFSTSELCLNITLLNVRSLRKHISEFSYYPQLLATDILLCTETQIEDNASIMNLNINTFQLTFNNDRNKYKSLMVGHKAEVIIDQIQNWSGFMLFTFKKEKFHPKKFKALLLYRSHSESILTFFNTLTMILGKYDLDFVLGDFNVNAFKDDKDNHTLQRILCGFKQIITYPTHIDGGLIDHVYVCHKLLTEFSIEDLKLCVSISDHDALKIKIQPLHECRSDNGVLNIKMNK